MRKAVLAYFDQRLSFLSYIGTVLPFSSKGNLRTCAGGSGYDVVNKCHLTSLF